MLEYEDDFFFEEDKMKKSVVKSREKPLVSQLSVCVPIENALESLSKPKDASENIEEVKNNDEINIMDTTTSVTTSSQCIVNDLRNERYQLTFQNLMGMTVTSGSVVIHKDESNLIGISIGGGAPLCPCLYIVQIFDNTPSSKDGTLQSGDEIVGVNGQTVKGKTKVEVAKMIQSAKDEVSINYNKLHADPQQGKSLDIVMKKVKHRLVENMSQSTADALGLSRAILCNDTLVKKLQELQKTEQMYQGLVEHSKRMLKAYFDLLQTYKQFGDVFASIGVREPQPRASEAFTKFGEYHRQMEKDGIKMLKMLKPILADIGTYLHKAIPDTKLTIKKYADTKFEYLSYCLKVKEMDDEEYSYSALQEPLYRVETGNYEYRLILRCRQDARSRFAQLRSDVLIKMELLDNKHVQDVVTHLQKFVSGLATYHNETQDIVKSHLKLFPIEVDLTQDAFKYKSTSSAISNDNAEDEEFVPEEIGKEAIENYNGKSSDSKPNQASISNNLLPDLDLSADDKLNLDNVTENTSLLAELGLDNIDVSQVNNMDSSKSSSSFFNLNFGKNDESKKIKSPENDEFTDFFSFDNQIPQQIPNESDSLLSGFN